MAINKELEAKIVRYHFVEKWRLNTIADQLHIHHSVVDRVLSQAGLPKAERATRPSKLDPYLPLIREALERYPKLTAARLYGKALARGYDGAKSRFRARIAQLRPRPVSELKTLPGEQIQVDRGHIGHVQIGKANAVVVRPGSLADYDQLNRPDTLTPPDQAVSDSTSTHQKQTDDLDE